MLGPARHRPSTPCLAPAAPPPPSRQLAFRLVYSPARTFGLGDIDVECRFIRPGWSAFRPLQLAVTWQIENVPRRIGMAFTDEPIPMPALSIPHVSPALARSAREHFQCLYARPLSDDELAHLLGAQGYPIARRTVAKYRDILKIPPSHLR